MDSIAPHPFLRQLHESLGQNAEREAFLIAGRRHSYAELAKAVGGIWRSLSQAGPGPWVGILAENQLETYASQLAVLFSGRGFVMLHPAHPQERNLDIARQAGIDLLLLSGHDPAAQRLPGIASLETRGLRHDALPGLDENPHGAGAYLLFTSGSTGKPKGVPITRDNLQAFFVSFFDIDFPFRPDDHWLQMFELTFDVSVATALLPLSLGARVLTVPSGGVKFMEVYRLLEEEGVTIATLVPSLLAHLRPYFDDIRLPGLRLCVVTAEASTHQLLEQWRPCAPQAPILNLYGPTEATIWCLAHFCLPDDERSGKTYNGMASIGKPMSQVQALVADADGNALPEGQKGELCVAGPQLTPGYLGLPERDAAAFFWREHRGRPTRFYRTGDLAFVGPDGDILCGGRLDNQVQVQGFRVELHEIEHAAAQAPGVANCVAMAFKTPEGIDFLALAVEAGPWGKDELHQWLKAKLPPYMVPEKIVGLEKFPLNPSEKVDRKALRLILAQTLERP